MKDVYNQILMRSPPLPPWSAVGGPAADELLPSTAQVDKASMAQAYHGLGAIINSCSSIMSYVTPFLMANGTG